MISVLDTPEARQTVYPLSVEFYHEAGRLGLIGEDVELLEGVLFTKMPKSPLHQFLARRLQRLLESLVPAGFFVDRESPITCRRSEPEPDVAVFAGCMEDFARSHPSTAELVIEIAVNTQQRDRSKAAIYAEAGVKEFWLVEPEAGLITLHTQPAAEGYQLARAFRAEEAVASTIFPEFAITLAELTA